jgi:hypothetical protein
MSGQRVIARDARIFRATPPRISGPEVPDYRPPPPARRQHSNRDALTLSDKHPAMEAS